jgi:ABC-type lipoprotein release transport system permease subunit
MPRLKQFTVAGIFSMDHNEFDSALALVAHGRTRR